MGKLSLIFMALLATSKSSAWFFGSNEARELALRQFNAGQDAYYASAGEGNAGVSFEGKNCVHPAADAVKNANTECTYSGCRVKCHKGYKIGTKSSVILSCDTTIGDLTYLGLPWETSLPPCLPKCGKDGCPNGQECVAPDTCSATGPAPSDCPPGFTGPDCEDFECDPPCQNGGTCIFVDVCNCSPGYWGLLCEKHYCAVPTESPAFATLGADNDLTRMKVECKNGYKMKSKASTATFICSHGQWIIPNIGTIEDIDINCYRE